MSNLLALVTALTRRSERPDAAQALGRHLGGQTLIAFVRDEEIDVLLPAPGFPQTFQQARPWRKLLADCIEQGECAASAVVPPEGGAALPAYAFAYGRDFALVVLGAAAWSPSLGDLLPLLPLLEAVFVAERAADHALARERVAHESAAHAEALAAAFDLSRIQLQRALNAAEDSRRALALANEQLEAANHQLGDQAVEMEVQADELRLQAEALQSTNLELETARIAADAANKAKSDFLATMSHELRTPLNAISGHVQLIELGIYGPVTDTQRTALERVDRSQRHLLGLINNILNLARIESGQVEYRLVSVRVVEALADIAPMVEPQMNAKSLRYEVRVADDTLSMCADKEKAEQILINLLSNAIKFTPSSGSITVSAGVQAGTSRAVEIHVTDSGIGIPEDKLVDIFAPFVQIDTGHSRASDGSGLGLAISRDLARGMGGDLSVRSTFGEGSTFTLTLPQHVATGSTF